MNDVYDERILVGVAPLPEFFHSLEGFQWDEGNTTKNWRRHQVSRTEAEQVFFNRPIVVTAAASTEAESRHFALGQTDTGRQLTIVFTLRGSLLRVISGRPMSRRERRIYAQASNP